MTGIAFRVQAHPARTLMAESLAQEVGGVVCGMSVTIELSTDEKEDGT